MILTVPHGQQIKTMHDLALHFPLQTVMKLPAYKGDILDNYTPRNPKDRRKDPLIKKGFSFVAPTLASPVVPITITDNGKWELAQCPECNTKVQYWTRGKPRYHHCTNCGKEVYL